MKVLKLLFVSLVCMAALTACEVERLITADQLPLPAQTYLQTNYQGINVTYAKKETELFRKKYKVRLNNGVEIEFNRKGAPIDLDFD